MLVLSMLLTEKMADRFQELSGSDLNIKKQTRIW